MLPYLMEKQRMKWELILKKLYITRRKKFVGSQDQKDTTHFFLEDNPKQYIVDYGIGIYQWCNYGRKIDNQKHASGKYQEV